MGVRYPPIQPPIQRYAPSPDRPHLLHNVPLPLHAGPPSQIRGPEGKILIFRIPAVSEAALDQLNGQVVAIRLEACVKAEHLILWHNLSELQVLLRLDFIQTASAMKEEMIRTLCEKNQLRKEVKLFINSVWILRVVSQFHTFVMNISWAVSYTHLTLPTIYSV